MRLGSAQKPDIVVNSVKKVDSKTAEVSYTIKDHAVERQFDIGIYRSTDNQFNSSDVRIGTAPATDLTVGTHSVRVSIPQGFLIDAVNHFVLGVADPGDGTNPNGKISESLETNNTAFFHEYIVGAVAVGFDPRSRLTSSPATWVNAMATSLGPSNGQSGHYDIVIPFSWDSARAVSGLASTAGDDLNQRIENAVRGLTLGENDIVDVHLIGHSRGAVVISRAFEDLQKSTIAPLRNGFWKMTLLDPHPANNRYGPNADFSRDLQGALARAFYGDFQRRALDPPVVVPSRVDRGELFYQKTPANRFANGTFQRTINLWGLGPDQIVNQSGKPLISEPLTGRRFGNTVVGHTEVHDWYQANIIPVLLISPYTSIPPPPLP